MKEINENRVLECYQKYKDTVFKLAYSYCKSVTQAEDVFQDVFEKFMQKAPDFSDEYHEKAWFIRVTIKACKNVLKLKWNKERVQYEDYMTPEKVSEKPEYELLRQAVLALPEKYRLPIHLYYYEEYSVREIAEILQRKESAVQTQLQRGREKIRRSLTEKGVSYETES